MAFPMDSPAARSAGTRLPELSTIRRSSKRKSISAPIPPREFGIQEKQPTNTKARRNLHNAHKKDNGYGVPPAIWVDWIELEGPLESAAVAAAQGDPRRTGNNHQPGKRRVTEKLG